MVEIIRGIVGSAKKGDKVSFSQFTEDRLVALGMARKVSEDEMSDSDICTSGSVYKTEEELKQLRTKKNIQEYASAIGCELDESMPFKDMVNAVLNFQEEKMDAGENPDIQKGNTVHEPDETTDDDLDTESDNDFGGPDV